MNYTMYDNENDSVTPELGVHCGWIEYTLYPFHNLTMNELAFNDSIIAEPSSNETLFKESKGGLEFRLFPEYDIYIGNDYKFGIELSLSVYSSNWTVGFVEEPGWIPREILEIDINVLPCLNNWF